MSLNIKQSRKWGEYLEYLGWKSLYLPQAVRIKKIGRWSVIKVQRPKDITEKFLDGLNNIAKKEKALFIKIEPLSQEDATILENNGYRKDSSTLSPSKTIKIDLRPPLEETYKNLSKDTRQKIKKMKKENPLHILALTNEKALKDFYGILRAVAKGKRFWIPSFGEFEVKSKALEKEGFMAIYYEDEIPISGAYILIMENEAYYEHAAHTHKGKDDSPYIVLWTVIKELKDRKIEALDLCGVYDERYLKLTKNWKAFSVFKSKWGGEVVKYPVQYIKYFSLVACWLGL